jgi:hypothetical protein
MEGRVGQSKCQRQVAGAWVMQPHKALPAAGNITAEPITRSPQLPAFSCIPFRPTCDQAVAW